MVNGESSVDILDLPVMHPCHLLWSWRKTGTPGIYMGLRHLGTIASKEVVRWEESLLLSSVSSISPSVYALTLWLDPCLLPSAERNKATVHPTHQPSSQISTVALKVEPGIRTAQSSRMPILQSGVAHKHEGQCYWCVVGTSNILPPQTAVTLTAVKGTGSR